MPRQVRNFRREKKSCEIEFTPALNNSAEVVSRTGVLRLDTWARTSRISTSRCSERAQSCAHGSGPSQCYCAGRGFVWTLARSEPGVRRRSPARPRRLGTTSVSSPKPAMTGGNSEGLPLRTSGLRPPKHPQGALHTASPWADTHLSCRSGGPLRRSTCAIDSIVNSVK